MIRKIWKDPVGSTVISVAIISLLTLVYTKVLSIIENITFKEAFNKILEVKISVLYLLLVLIGYWILKFLFKIIFKKKGYYSPKQQKIRSFNKTTDNNAGILFRWNVYFDYNKPFISDLTAFCVKHGEPPIRFIDNRCPFRDCVNSQDRIDKYAVKNFIESDLINRWEKIK